LKAAERCIGSSQVFVLLGNQTAWMIIILKTSSLEAQNYVRFVLPTSEEGGFGRNQPSWFPLF
jgi:hypothetical protein